MRAISTKRPYRPGNIPSPQSGELGKRWETGAGFTNIKLKNNVK